VICLTGDLHHMTLGTGNQRAADDTEVRIAGRFLHMLEEAGVQVTFFVSGRAFQEEAPDLRPIWESEAVEIGGHNYSCFQPEIWHRACKKLLGSYNGPYWQQKRDALRTKEAIRNRTGRTIRVWRNHMYMHGPHTERALADAGLELCSDGVQRDATGPVRHEAGIWNFPLNVIPDHEHIYHAERTPEWVEGWVKRYDWSDDFGPDSYYVEEWTEIVLENLRANEARGAVSNMIIHPITLYLADRFRSFQKILDVLADSETVQMSHVVDLADAGLLPAAHGAALDAPAAVLGGAA